VGALKAANYTRTSWSVFTLALDSANAVLANKAATEEQVAAALASLIASTGALQTAAPVINQVSKLASTRPVIKGTVKHGKTVKVAKGTWTAGSKLTVKWYINHKKVKTASKLTLKKSWKGKKLVVKVTGSKSGFTSVTRASVTKKIK
jgi:hypothetical protein